MLLVVRPLTGTLRCAACHDELDGARFACPGCRVVLHRDCRAGLKRCPTYGCSVAPRGPTATSVETPQQQRALLFHLVWLVPGLLSLLWPVWFGLLGGRSHAALAFALVLGPAIGNGCLATYARATGDPGSPHVRAAVAAGVGLGASVHLIVLFVVAVIVSMC
jgi:hypothetical protein